MPAAYDFARKIFGYVFAYSQVMRKYTLLDVSTAVIIDGPPLGFWAGTRALKRCKVSRCIEEEGVVGLLQRHLHWH